jgi:hypothetical protein
LNIVFFLSVFKQNVASWLLVCHVFDGFLYVAGHETSIAGLARQCEYLGSIMVGFKLGGVRCLYFIC